MYKTKAATVTVISCVLVSCFTDFSGEKMLGICHQCILWHDWTLKMNSASVTL